MLACVTSSHTIKAQTFLLRRVRSSIIFYYIVLHADYEIGRWLTLITKVFMISAFPGGLCTVVYLNLLLTK